MGRTVKRYRKKFNKVKQPPKPKESTFQKVTRVAYDGYKAAMWVKNLINVEHKSLDNTINSQISYDGFVSIINVPPQGITDHQRVGDSILNKQFRIRGWLQRQGADTMVRMIIIKDKQNTVTTTADYFQSTGTIYSPFEYKKEDNMFQSKKLYDELYCLTTDENAKVFDVKLNDLDDHTTFDNATTTITTNAYKIIFISDQVPSSGTEPTVTYRSRFDYIDN